MNLRERTAYYKSQVIANLLINSGLNGIIAYYFYRSREIINFDEAAVDIQITVAIIAFIVSWIGISTLRKRLASGEVGLLAAGARMVFFPFPANAVLRSLAITAVLMLLYGGLVLIGPLYLIRTPGLPNWGYILLKPSTPGVRCLRGSARLAE